MSRKILQNIADKLNIFYLNKKYVYNKRSRGIIYNIEND